MSRDPTQPKQANRFPRGPMTPAVRQMKPLMAWTPRPKPYGTPPKIRLPGLAPAISKKRRSLTALI
jgi:hypothetical protein